MRPLCCSLAAALLLLALPARAAGPELRALYPPGAQRGATVEITASGNFPKWPVSAWVDRPGVSVAAAKDSGKLTATIAADAAPGLYWVRVYDAYAGSAPHPFLVGTLPEVVEQEPNNAPAKAQAMAALPVVVNGRLKGGDADLFAAELRKGQTLVAALEAHETLASPVDAVLQLASPRGAVLAYNHDERGLDPRIVFAAPLDGPCVARVFGFPSTPNSTIGLSGGEKYLYRLTLTTGPFVDYAWPLAVTAGSDARVELHGWNLPDDLRSLVIKATGTQVDVADPRLANVVSVAVEPHATIVEAEPNEPAAPQAVELPVTISGRIEKSRDQDVYAFDGKKGDALIFQLESRTLGYPLDGVLEISDSMGKSLARADDTDGTRDCQLAFSPPADGRYRVAVSDLTRQGSDRHVYRLRATKAQADFELAADAHGYVVTAGKPTDVTLTVTRRNGFNEPIAISVTGLPAFVTAAPVQSAAEGETAKTVKLSLSTTGGSFSGPIHVIGTSTGASKLTRTATAAIPNTTARTADAWFTVVPASP